MEARLLQILNRRPWYSYGTGMLCRKLQITRDELLRVAHASSEDINVFTYNNIEYMGLESRRLDYERDKANGVNPVEDLIAHGAYNKCHIV